MDQHNNALDRLSKANPVLDDVVENQFALERMIRSATAPQPGIWSRARYAVTASTAALGSGAAVLALIVGLSSAAPELPMLALDGASGAKMSAPADAVLGVATTLPSMVGGMAIYHPNYTFQVSPDLVVNGDNAGSYHLSTSKSLKQIVEDLANIFHVVGDQVGENNNFSVTGTDGRTLYASENGGVVNWSYSASQTVSPPDVASTERIAALPAPSNDDAKSKARELFDAVGYFGSVGNLEASRFDQFGGQEVQQVVQQSVQVSAQLVVNGVETDQVLSATYDGKGLSGANGVLADLGGAVNYPTISATDAVSALQASWNPAPQTTEATVVAPDNTGTVEATGGFDETSSPSAEMAPGESVAPSGVSPTSGDASTGVAPDATTPPQVDPAPTYTTVPPQTVTITTATLRYQTYQLENGQTWLLPVWTLNGYVGSDKAQEFSQTELAVSSNYVKLPQSNGVMTY
jgi:hypothetical protein